MKEYKIIVGRVFLVEAETDDDAVERAIADYENLPPPDAVTPATHILESRDVVTDEEAEAVSEMLDDEKTLNGSP